MLSAGHASTLLYSMLQLAGVKSVNPQYELARGEGPDSELPSFVLWILV